MINTSITLDSFLKNILVFIILKEN